jgi:hypothetical protein
VQNARATELSAEERREVAAWIEENSARLPEPVRMFLALHQKYLAAGVDLRRPFDTAWRELRRALGITPSSERRRSGNPLSSVPPTEAGDAKSERTWLERQHERSVRLSDWHKGLKRRHQTRAKRLKEKLAKMSTERSPQHAPRLDVRGQEVTENTPVEEIELTEEEKAESAASAEVFAGHLELGDGADQSLQSVNETLMPGGAVLASEAQESLAVELPAGFAEADVVKTLHEPRVRYDFSVTVTRIDLDVEKKVVEKNGERRVVAASTRDFGPPRYAVTWSALATLAVMVGQFALPFHRLATMLSTTAKRFTAGSLSRMLHYVAERLVPIYLELAGELANSEILAGDDTSCRVLEVASYFAESKAEDAESGKKKPPWAEYQTPRAAQESFLRCEAEQKARMRRREEGDREAKRTPEETASLGVLIGRRLTFESPRRDGNGPKASMNTTVVSGRSVAADPRSLIVFYRSHLGGCGNLLESILRHRDRKARDVVLQTDLSTTNLVTSPELLGCFKLKLTGCAAHARRPFANYEDEDPVNCSYMLHLFCGLAIHEQRLDVHGRNRENVLAVRKNESRELWEEIRELAQQMTSKWSPATKLGTGARYIVKHYVKLTAYLDDPRLEATNNLRERMLRMEKLIEGSSMFRQSLEGRFVLDVVRTILQTAVAAGVPVHAYLESVLRADADDVAEHPERFTPRAWAAANATAGPDVATRG